MRFVLSLVLSLPLALGAQPCRVVKRVEGLDHPWSLAFLPDGRMLVTERPGRLNFIGRDFKRTNVEGVPLYYWVPSIAPSGMAFYTGDRFPRWKGNLFVGALRDEMLVRLELDGEKVMKEERLPKGVLGRIRDVRNGPDGYLYLLTDESPGVLARLEP